MFCCVGPHTQYFPLYGVINHFCEPIGNILTLRIGNVCSVDKRFTDLLKPCPWCRMELAKLGPGRDRGLSASKALMAWAALSLNNERC